MNFLQENQRWAKSREGKKTLKIVTGETVIDPKDRVEWGLRSEIKMALEVLGKKKVGQIIKSILK